MLTLKDLPRATIRAIRKGLGENVAIGDDEAVRDQCRRAGHPLEEAPTPKSWFTPEEQPPPPTTEEDQEEQQDE